MKNSLVVLAFLASAVVSACATREEEEAPPLPTAATKMGTRMMEEQCWAPGPGGELMFGTFEDINGACCSGACGWDYIGCYNHITWGPEEWQQIWDYDSRPLQCN
jgi:hypothetical protein